MCELDDFDEFSRRASEVSRRQFGAMALAAGLTAALPRLASATETKGADVEIKTPDGTCDAYVVHPAKGKHPAVLIWPDIFGLPPAGLLQQADEDDGMIGKVFADAGKIRAYAASNYTADRLAGALRVAADNGYRGFVALQPHYNLVHRDDYEGELADVCRTSGVSCVSYSSLADGFLTGKYRPGAALPTSERAEDATVYLNDAGLRVLRALDSVATEVNWDHHSKQALCTRGGEGLLRKARVTVDSISMLRRCRGYGLGAPFQVFSARYTQRGYCVGSVHGRALQLAVSVHTARYLNGSGAQ